MSSNCPKINPCITLALTAVQEEIFPLSTTLCLLLLKKIPDNVQSTNHQKCHFGLVLRLSISCQTLSNALICLGRHS